MELNREVLEFKKGFASCSEMLNALGDETRQHLILEMISIGDCNGVRVGNITEKTNLSRSAVSHHLQILKNVGIVKLRKEGTKNYYYFDPKPETLELLISTLKLASDISKSLPDRSGE